MSYRLSFFLIMIIIALFGLLIWFVIINFGSSKINQTLIKIIGFIAAAILIIIFDIYSINYKYSKSIKVLIPINEIGIQIDSFSKKLIYSGSEHNQGLDIMSKIQIMRVNKNKIQPKEINIKSLDLLENAFWTWFSNNYHLHWQVDKKNFTGIAGAVWTIDKSENATKKTCFIEPEDIQEMLNNNYFIISKADIWGIHLPNNSKLITIVRNNYERTYKIVTANLELHIKIFWVGNSGIEFTKLGNKIIEEFQNGNWLSNNFRVEFECKLKRSRIFSNETERQLEWVKEIQNNFYNDFDWSLIKSDLEKAYFIME